MQSPFAKMAFSSESEKDGQDSLDSQDTNLEHYAWLNRLHRAAHVAKVLRNRVVLERTTSLPCITSCSLESVVYLKSESSAPAKLTNELVRKKLVYPVRFIF